MVQILLAFKIMVIIGNVFYATVYADAFCAGVRCYVSV